MLMNYLLCKNIKYLQMHGLYIILTDARLKRESQPINGSSFQAHAPLQPRASQPIMRPTLSDLAETALAVTGGIHKSRWVPR